MQSSPFCLGACMYSAPRSVALCALPALPRLPLAKPWLPLLCSAAQAGTPVQGESGSQSVQCARPVAARLVRRPPWLMPAPACSLAKLWCLPSRHSAGINWCQTKYSMNTLIREVCMSANVQAALMLAPRRAVITRQDNYFERNACSPKL